MDSKQRGLPNKQTDRQINRLSKCTSLILCRVNGLFMNVSSWQGKERNGMYCVIHYMYVCPNKHRNQRIESRLWVLNDRKNLYDFVLSKILIVYKNVDSKNNVLKGDI